MNDTSFAQGSCNCGQVSFELRANTAPLTDVYVCHCSICRKSTGSGGIPVAVTPAANLSWTSGQTKIKTWTKPGHDWATSFCMACGSPLPGKNSEDTCYIPVSLLDAGYEALRVKHHIFVESKAVWEQISDDGEQHAAHIKG